MGTGDHLNLRLRAEHSTQYQHCHDHQYVYNSHLARLKPVPELE